MESSSVGPNFIILGAAKSGTTALYRWLQQHPAVYMPSNKQPHYFAQLQPTFRGPGDQALNRDIVSDLGAYLALFAPGADRPARGEASPFYLFYARRVAENIRATTPHCRLIVLLREPVARAYSGYLHLVRDGRERGSFAQALANEEERLQSGWEPLWGHRALGLYGQQLAEILRIFPREQVGVWLYEEMRRPEVLFAEVCRFLAIDDRFVPVFSHHNTGGAPRHPNLHALLVRLRVPHIAKRLLPESWAQWVVARYLDRRPAPTDLAAELRAFFAPDTARLLDLLPNKDFSSWVAN